MFFSMIEDTFDIVLFIVIIKVLKLVCVLFLTDLRRDFCNEIFRRIGVLWEALSDDKRVFA